MPSARKRLHALSPSSMSGTLTTMLSATRASSRPSRTMASASVATTSALTGPSTMRQISARISRGSPSGPAAFASREGFVVMPSMSPASTARRTSLRSAVSRKIFIQRLLPPHRVGAVVHTCEEQPLCGRGRGGLERRLAPEQRGHVLQRPHTARDVHHRAHEVSYHVVEKTVRRDVEHDAVVPPGRPAGPVHGAAIAALRLAGLGEGPKGMLADEQRRGGLERRRV